MESTEQSTATGVFCTEDMALATVLGMQGYNTSNLAWKKSGSRAAEWQFDRDDRLDRIVSDYNAGTHQVEPRQFTIHLKRVRKQLYDFRD